MSVRLSLCLSLFVRLFAHLAVFEINIKFFLENLFFMVHVNRMTIASYEERVPKTVNYTGALKIIAMLTYSLAKNKF